MADSKVEYPAPNCLAPAAIEAKTEAAGADALNAAGIAFNLSAATLGNIVGGAVLVAFGYWFIFAKKSEV